MLSAFSMGSWAWQNEAQPKAEVARDFSTPATRLVGRWKSADLMFASSECEFFGPVDAATKTGVFTRYLHIGRDKKTKQPIWKQFDFKYQVISEDSAGDRVTVNMLLANGDSRPESYSVEHNGLLRISKTVCRGNGVFSEAGLHGRQEPGLPREVNTRRGSPQRYPSCGPDIVADTMCAAVPSALLHRHRATVRRDRDHRPVAHFALDRSARAFGGGLEWCAVFILRLAA